MVEAATKVLVASVAEPEEAEEGDAGEEDGDEDGGESNWAGGVNGRARSVVLLAWWSSISTLLLNDMTPKAAHQDTTHNNVDNVSALLPDVIRPTIFLKRYLVQVVVW
jgi:hypothetical protein